MKKLYLLALSLLIISSLSAQAIWSDDFENGIDNWTTIDVDGDGNNWELNDFFATHSGTQCIASASWSGSPLTPNNYISSPIIDLINETGPLALSWWAYAQDQAWAAEHYEVWISNDNTQAGIEAGTMVFEETLSAYGEYVERTVDISAYAGQAIFVTFVHNDVSDFFWVNIDDVSIFKPASDDAGVLALVSPSNDNSCMLSNAEEVTISVFNYGGNAIHDFEVSYSVNGGTAVTAMVPDTIAPASSKDFTFPTTADLSALGEYEITVATNLTGDSDNTNDEATYNLRHTDDVLTVHVMTDITAGQSWTVTDLTTGMVVAEHGAYAWNLEFSDNVCIYSDRCYSFEYTCPTEMGPGAYLELLLNGVPVAGDASGNGVPTEFIVGALGGGCAANEAGLTSINTKSYVEQTGNVVSGTLRNNGAAAINSLVMSYSVDGGTPVTETFSGLNTLSGAEYEYTFTQTLDLPDVSEYTLEVTIDSVNGEVDAVLSNNSATKDLAVVSFVPDRAVVVEESTGTWCTWCPRGFVAMEYLEKFDNFIGIAVHGAVNDPSSGFHDPMTVTPYIDGLDGFTGGLYPYMIMDRELIDVMPNDLAGMSTLDPLFERQEAQVSPATVDIKVSMQEGSRDIAVEVTSEFVVPVSGDFRFNAVVVEDSVTGTGDGYAQINAYAGGNAGPMNGWENLPNPVPASDMVYDKVARAPLGGWAGATNSIPANNSRGDIVSHTFNYSVPVGYNIDNLKFVGMLIDQSSGFILNAKQTADIEVIVGTEELVLANTVKVFPNPFSQTTNVQLALEDSREVSLEVTNALGQRVAYREYGQLAGDTVLPFDGSNLSSGLYFIRVQLDDELVVRKVMLAK